jgi:hypothetical protein
MHSPGNSSGTGTPSGPSTPGTDASPAGPAKGPALPLDPSQGLQSDSTSNAERHGHDQMNATASTKPLHESSQQNVEFTPVVADSLAADDSAIAHAHLMAARAAQSLAKARAAQKDVDRCVHNYYHLPFMFSIDATAARKPDAHQCPFTLFYYQDSHRT